MAIEVDNIVFFLIVFKYVLRSAFAFFRKGFIMGNCCF